MPLWFNDKAPVRDGTILGDFGALSGGGGSGGDIPIPMYGSPLPFVQRLLSGGTREVWQSIGSVSGQVYITTDITLPRCDPNELSRASAALYILGYRITGDFPTVLAPVFTIWPETNALQVQFTIRNVRVAFEIDIVYGAFHAIDPTNRGSGLVITTGLLAK